MKGFGLIWVIVGILVLGAAVGGGAYFAKLGPFSSSSPQQTACTMEAKLCPDGSSVGRTGPNCEFAACPSEKTEETTNWKTYTDNHLLYSINHPSNWTVKVGDVTFLQDGNGMAVPAKQVSLIDESGNTKVTLHGNFQGGYCYGDEESSTQNIKIPSGLQGILTSCGDNRYYSLEVGSNRVTVITKSDSLSESIVNTLSKQ